ncbi:MAG: hypothetical protein AAB778_02895 [Patescibacteria group bacterium]
MESAYSNITSQKYHEIFDFKLTKDELHKWQYKNVKEFAKGFKNKTRLQREKYSKKKLKLAKRAAILISKIPTVKFVGITGALAMNNAGRNSDIDLMIITKSGRLWMTRLLSYMAIWLNGYKTRKPNQKNEKNKLCINLWMDENDLTWNKLDRNIYTAHEIAQIVPLVNKNNIYERFLRCNRWILNFWPNSVKILRSKKTSNFISIHLISWLMEKLAYNIQYLYMSRKITREVVTPTRAIFHPNDWGKIVLEKLNKI